MAHPSLVWVVLGPTLALVYEVSVAIFLAAFGEISWDARLYHVGLRVALVVAVVALDQAQVTVALILIALAPSLYCMHQTRTFVAGPAPPLVDMTGKVVLVTGANTGIGKQTASQLAARGATVILACRDEEKAKAAIRDIQRTLPASTLRRENAKEPLLLFLKLDLSSFESIRTAANTFADLNLNRLDVLINNAGVMFSEKQISKDGFEMCLQANHLGHFLFTLLLLPHMQRQQTPTGENNKNHDYPRILNLTSITYKMAINGFDFEDYNCSHNIRPYTLFGQYAQSKLANILFTKELTRRYPNVASLAINPGIVRTDVTRNMSIILRYGNYLFGFLVRCYQKTPTEGAYSSVWAATTPVTLVLPTTGDTENETKPLLGCCPNGSFISNSKPELSTDPHCDSESDAKRLWELSETLVGWTKK
jgi:NAD(P)-dependent dehydrogenase (short-subunit alcohol dehydrogenase family)